MVQPPQDGEPDHLLRVALELIAKRGSDARFFWVDKQGDRHEQMTVADLARAVLNDEIDPAELTLDRRRSRR